MVTLSRISHLLLLAMLPILSACKGGGGGGGVDAHSVRKAMAQEPADIEMAASVAFRFANRAGPGVRLYTLPMMEEIGWRFETPNLVAEQLVGFASSEDQIYVRTSGNQLVALDLTSGRDRTVDTAVAAATLGPTGVTHLVHQDGRVGTVVDRRVRDWTTTLPVLPDEIWGTTRGRLLAVFAEENSRRLELLADSSQGVTSEVPDGLLAATVWGDLVAVAADAGLYATRTLDGTAVGFLPLLEEVTAMTFSASGHRLYVATATPELIVVERFQFTILSRRTLPGPVESLRTGTLGQYLLMQPVERDSVWLSDAAWETIPLSIEGSWEDDLPAVAPDGTVLIRRGSDVSALDPRTGREVGRVQNAAQDRWLPVAWDARRPTLLFARAADTTTAGSSDQRVYVQLSSTSNESWAQARVGELLEAHLSARLLQPTGHYDRYRVVLGPYGTREEADNIGRRLGQPYFIIFQDSTATNQ